MGMSVTPERGEPPQLFGTGGDLVRDDYRGAYRDDAADGAAAAAAADPAADDPTPGHGWSIGISPTELVDDLTLPQRAAVEHRGGPLLVVAKMPVPTILEITRAVALKKPSCRSSAGVEAGFRTVAI